jgi:hypothetical protein
VPRLPFLILAVLIAVAPCHGAVSEATVSIQQTKESKKRCELAIAAVDDHRLKSPQKQVRLSPGRHLLAIQVNFVLGNSKGESFATAADAPLEQVFEPHHYTIDGTLSPTGGLKLHIEDQEKKREYVRSRKRHE